MNGIILLRSKLACLLGASLVLHSVALAQLAARVPVNLAAVATASASFVSGDTTVSALNDGATPRNSRDRNPASYGNWNRPGTQWVQYEWSQPISTNHIDVYWWADGRGVGLPKACRVLAWDGTQFVPVKDPAGLSVLGDQFNSTTFAEVRTTKLRLEIDSQETLSTGILEWKVYDTGRSPKFPPTVAAGVDRTVVLGGKTYLAGKVTALGGAGVTAAWSKESGPGEVTFADRGAATTTATFSALGDYTLKLTGNDAGLSGAGTLKVKVTAPPPPDILNVVYTKNYTIDSPLWNARTKALITHWIPHCIDQINTPNLRQGAGGIDNFIDAANKRAGKPYERHRGYVFSNAWVHQTVESMCIALMIDPKGDPEIMTAQEKMKTTLEDWIPKILAAQEPDGYLQTAIQLGNGRRWTDRGAHEGYTAGYFIESAINHYTMTDGRDLRLYNAAKKLADCWCDNLGPAPKKEWFDGHQEMEQALVRFGRFVNDMEGAGKGDRYIALAKFLLDCRKNGSEYDQSHVPVIQQYEAVGHAVRAVYSYSGMADVAAETHDIDYQSAVVSLWDNLVNRKYYVTGGVGSGETSEGFGPNYSLRNNAYCESCSSCGEIFFQWKMNLAYHDARYADLFEETIYNALLGSTDLVGENFYYANPLRGGQRTAWHACPCCVGNIPRTLLMIPTWAYARSAQGLYVNLFIGSTINVGKVAGTDVQVSQKTDYPWNGKVALTVNPKTPARFTVYVRVPNRSTSALYAATPEVNGLTALSVNGAPVAQKIEHGYALITRDWKAGDRIDFEVPMTVQKLHADSRIADDVGRVALRYGPLVYNIERADQNIDQPLARDAVLSPEWRADLLGGVMTLKGNFADGSPLLAIPNYARNNRLDPTTAASRQAGAGSIVWIAEK